MLISNHFTTNNYHLFRAGLFARMAGLKADGIGAKPLLFLPNAFIRVHRHCSDVQTPPYYCLRPSCHRYGYVILNRIDYSVKKEFPMSLYQNLFKMNVCDVFASLL